MFVQPTRPFVRATRRPLPAPLTPLIGRADDIAALRAALLGDETRLVTVLGPGGSGKTRLALAAAAEVADRDDLAVVFVDLTPVRDAGEIVAAIGRVLDPDAPDQHEFDRIASELHRAVDLLVLDNLEQIAGAAEPVGSILRACSALLVLATSRAPLRLSGEQRFPVGPLALPTGAGAAEIEQSEAVALFVRRARLVRPEFALTEANRAEIAAICRRLDGMPLAIELAAARIASLSPAALLARLDKRLTLLTSSPADASVRHRTMRDAIAWSYDLLDPSAQRFFRQASIFPAGFELDLAEALAAGDTLELIERLLESSLLISEPVDGGVTRYRMYETIREYGLERLSDAAEREQSLDRLVTWFERQFADLTPRRSGAFTIEDTWRVEHNWPTLELLLAHLDAAGRYSVMLAFLTRLTYPLATRGRGSVAYSWLGRALAGNPELDDRRRAEALLALGTACHSLGRLNEERQALVEAIALADRVGDDILRQRASYALGRLAYSQGDYAGAQELLETAVALAEGNAPRRRWAENMLAFVYVDTRDPKAATIFRRHAAEARESGSRQDIGIALGNLAAVTLDDQAAIALYREAIEHLVVAGDRDSQSQSLAERGVLEVRVETGALGLDCIEQALKMAIEDGNRWAQSVALRCKGIALTAMQRADQAIDPLKESVAIAHQLGVRVGVAESLYALGVAEYSTGRCDWGASLIGAADGVRMRMGLPVDPLLGDLVRIRAIRDDPARREAIAAGAQRTDAEAAELAVQGAAETHLGTTVSSGSGRPPSPPLALAEPLTPRELDVLRLLAAGKTNSEIGDVLFISPFTAKTHVANLLGKLGLENRAAAAGWAAARGIA